LSLSVAKLGNIRAHTLRAFSAAEMEKILEKVPEGQTKRPGDRQPIVGLLGLNLPAPYAGGRTAAPRRRLFDD